MVKDFWLSCEPGLGDGTAEARRARRKLHKNSNLNIASANCVLISLNVVAACANFPATHSPPRRGFTRAKTQRRQVRKNKITFLERIHFRLSDLCALASLREIFRLSVAALPRCVSVMNNSSQETQNSQRCKQTRKVSGWEPEDSARGQAAPGNVTAALLLDVSSNWSPVSEVRKTSRWILFRHARESGHPVGAGLKPAPTKTWIPGRPRPSPGLPGMTSELCNELLRHQSRNRCWIRIPCGGYFSSRTITPSQASPGGLVLYSSQSFA